MSDPMVYALDRAQRLMGELTTIKDILGQLDDYYETEYIDNRLLSNLGAYQHIDHAIKQLRNFAWEIGEHLANEDGIDD